MRKNTFEKQLKLGARIEHKEHPWANQFTARKIAKDHIREGKRYRRGG